MARILGIDIGSHTVKVAVLEGSFNRFELQDYHLRVVAQDLDSPPDEAARLEALSQLLEDTQLHRGALSAVGFPAEGASVRLIKLPFAEKAKVEQALPFEVEQQVPFDLDDMVLAPRVLQLQPGDSRVLAAMAPREGVAAQLATLNALGVDPKVLAIDADLLGRYADRGVQAVVDLGHRRTLVTLSRDGKTLGSRAISGGGWSLTRALADAHGLSWGEAEGHKHVSQVHPLPERPPEAAAAVPAPARPDPDAETRIRPLRAVPAEAEWEDDDPTHPEASIPPSPPPPETLRPPRPVDPVSMGWTLRDAVLPLLAEVRTSLLAFEDQHACEIDEVLLCGGSAELGGVRELLSEILGVPVRSLSVSELAVERGQPERLALCHALGRSIAGNKKAGVLDLRRDEFAFKGDLATLGNIAKWGLLAGLVLMMAGVGLFGVRMVQLNQRVGELDQEIAAAVMETFPDVSPDRLDDSSMALAIMQERTLETTSRVDTLGALVSEEPPTMDTLRAVSEAMPPPAEARVDIREMLITTSTITMKGQTDGYEEVAKIEKSLQQEPAFKNATRGDESKTKAGAVKFTVTIPLGADDGEEG